MLDRGGRVDVRCVGLAMLAMPLVGGRVAEAQLFRGTVIDSATSRPVSDARVSILDSTASIIASLRTDRKGAFKLRAPDPGTYAIDVRAVGLRPQTSGWIAATATDTFEVTLRVTPVTTVLDAVVVKAQRDSIVNTVNVLGMRPGTFGGRLITPAEIDQVRSSARDYLDILQSASAGGFRVVWWRDRYGVERRCYARGSSPASCLKVVVDNLPMNSQDAIDAAPPDQIDYVIVLRPAEAGVMFGGDTINGVLIIATKASRTAKPR